MAGKRQELKKKKLAKILFFGISNTFKPIIAAGIFYLSFLMDWLSVSAIIMVIHVVVLPHLVPDNYVLKFLCSGTTEELLLWIPSLMNEM